jgi:hypothetical protein
MNRGGIPALKEEIQAYKYDKKEVCGAQTSFNQARVRAFLFRLAGARGLGFPTLIAQDGLS